MFTAVGELPRSPLDNHVFKVITLFPIESYLSPTLVNTQFLIKCLFYLRDCRGGQGERRFFRVAFNYLCNMDKAVAIKLLPMVAE